MESDPGIFAAAHALDAQHLLVRAPTDGERDEIIAGVHHWRLTATTTAAAAEQGAKAAATTAAAALTRRAQQIAKLLRATREGVEHILNILLAAPRRPLPALRRGAPAPDHGPLARTRHPSAP